jgi:hypothetical protein
MTAAKVASLIPLLLDHTDQMLRKIGYAGDALHLVRAI